ncbi:hypothetical protein FOA52_004805 [Chlamydomonas sp. UWO 241]|nr:hypothetical protein FOA52_004805 [Chlamydomonas sp. UWO 241]
MGKGEGFYAKFVRKGFALNTFEDVIDVSGGTMKRSLRGWQLMLLGIGTMVGAGVFVSTGSVAQDKAGPAVLLSYLFAGLACILSALCYAEYSCELPMAGGAFNFITVTFGEFAGWLVACNLFIEWTLANAAVAKGFSGYFAALFGIDPTVFTPYAYQLAGEPGAADGFRIEINWLAPLFLAVLTGVLLLGTSQSTLVQNCSVAVYLVLIAFIIFAGASQVDNSNYTPFTPYGISGIFKGASSIFFSFVGFDMVASMAEECVNPAKDLPLGIVGSVGVATAIYVAMSTVLVGMVSYLELDPNAPFASVFTAVGMDWAAKIVGVGALIGCTNSEFGGLMGQSRIFVTMGRAGLLPKSLGKMSSRSVPFWSILWSGGIAAVLALFLAIEQLFDFVSMGTLFAYMAVCFGLLWKRYVVVGVTPQHHKWAIAGLLWTIVVAASIVGFATQFAWPTGSWAAPLGVCLLSICAFYMFPMRCIPSAGNFVVPLVPWIPAGGIIVNCFLIGTLPKFAFFFWFGWMVLCIAIYLVYGLHHTQGEDKVKAIQVSGGVLIEDPESPDRSNDHPVEMGQVMSDGMGKSFAALSKPAYRTGGHPVIEETPNDVFARPSLKRSQGEPSVSGHTHTGCKRAGSTSRYRGVSWCKAKSAWHVDMDSTRDTRYMFIGSYSSEEDAARAYDCTAVRLLGPGAKRNFPGETVSEIPALPKKQKMRSMYIGVSWSKAKSAWQVRMEDLTEEDALRRRPQKVRHIGRFTSEEDAARAYDRTAEKTLGAGTMHNFPREAISEGGEQEQRTSSRFTGVCWDKASSSWRARVWVPQTKHHQHIGSYVSEEDAARAYDCTAVRLLGPDAKRNFPGETVSEMPVAQSKEREQHKSSRFTGVCWDKASSSWRARLYDPQTKHQQHIGCYASEEDAARAYDRTAVKALGAGAKCNFTNEAISEPLPVAVAICLPGQLNSKHHRPSRNRRPSNTSHAA